MRTTKKMSQFIENWEKIEKIKIFEISVLNKITNQNDYIIFNIELIDCYLYAYHEPTNTKEQNSSKIAFVRVLIDADFSIDEHLQSLYEECLNKIIRSEFFGLID